MATISTIMPAGGGDYSTLQAWEDFADGEASADQHAECYTGGNLGSLSIESWASTPSSTLYPRVYAAEGNKHNGDIAGGAFISAASGNGVFVNVDYGRVEDLRITATGSSANGLSFGATVNRTGIIISGLLIHDCAANGINASSLDANLDFIIKNCIFIDNAPPGAGSNINYIHYALSGSRTTAVGVYNCTAHTGDFGFNLSATEAGGTMTGTLDCVNCCAFGNAEADFLIANAAGVTETISNNASDDATADDFGGSGHLVDQTDTDWFANVSGDNLELKPTSPGRNAGTAIASVTNDVAGRARPQEGTYDIGAHEYPFQQKIISM